MADSTAITPRWLDLHAASRYCSLHRQTLMIHVHAGDVYAKLVGGKWILDRNSLDSWLESDKVLVAKLSRRR